MTHIKLKYDVPYCLLAFKVKYEGEFCGQGCNCPHLEGNDICRYLRFQHREVETDVFDYAFTDNPDPEPGITFNNQTISTDLITYLEIDGRVLIDF